MSRAGTPRTHHTHHLRKGNEQMKKIGVGQWYMAVVEKAGGPYHKGQKVFVRQRMTENGQMAWEVWAPQNDFITVHNVGWCKEHIKSIRGKDGKPIPASGAKTEKKPNNARKQTRKQPRKQTRKQPQPEWRKKALENFRRAALGY